MDLELAFKLQNIIDDDKIQKSIRNHFQVRFSITYARYEIIIVSFRGLTDFVFI